MPINFNGLDVNGVNFNNQLVEEVYYNNVFVWPFFTQVYYKYVFLEHIFEEHGVDENSYELHLSNKKLDDDYIFVPSRDAAPAWQLPQPNVVGPNGEQYATPMSFVRRVVFDNAIVPKYINNWFCHLFGGLNYEWLSDRYPFEWVNPQSLKCIGTESLECAFQQCHAPYIDLRSFNTFKVYNTKCMFNKCSAKHIYISNQWDMTNVEDSYHMFHEAYYLPKYDSGVTDKSMAKPTTQGGYLELL